LFGYVVTTPKATAETLLLTERGDPLLTQWQFGLGKAVAFTSDAKSRWAGDWIRWPGYSAFWAQLVRSVLRTSDDRGNETTLSWSGNEGRIVVDSVDERGRFRNGLVTTAQRVDPEFEREAIELAQTAPGRYEATFPVEEAGSYLFRIQQRQPNADGAFANYTRGFTISYRPEYRHLTTNEAFLERLATVTGGAYDPTPEMLASGGDRTVAVRQRIWPWLLAAALLLFLIDVALRRLDLAGWRIGGGVERYG